jgi:hypothetical protein
MYFLRKTSENDYVLQRQFSVLECNAATRVLCGIEISILVSNGMNERWVKLYGIGTDKSRLKSLLRIKDGTITVENGVLGG